MDNLDFFRARRSGEMPAFSRVLKALPSGKLDYRPHPKSRSAAELAWLLAELEGSLATLVQTGTILWKETKPPAKADEIVAAFEKNAAAVDAGLGKLDAAGWDKKVSFVMEGSPPWEDTMGNFFWGFLFDAVHHRGQLTTYLRPMGGKVPSIYGPSADDAGQ
jgi:uncharacterized damage-inducible protein DinB